MKIFLRRALVLLLVLAAASGLAPVRVARAQETLVILSTPAPEYEFGKTMTFQVSARSSSAEIVGATVFVRAFGLTSTFVGEARLTPGREITATYALNLNMRPLPPFAPVQYWWEVRDRAGGSTTSEPQSFTYEDNRFEWRTLNRDGIAVHWHEGQTAFGQAALDVAAAALERGNRDIQAPLPQQVNIYIYADAQSAQAALAPLGLIWADGYANPPLGVVVVAVAEDVEAVLNFEREIPHELMHILIYQATGVRYPQVPTWLNEGLAVMNQGQPDPGFPAALEAARQAGTLLHLRDLCGPLPADPALAQLAYAESESVVRYLRDTYGVNRLIHLLAAYADGLGCAPGVERALGISLEALERQWLEATFRVGALNPLSRNSDPLPWVILAGLVLFVPALLFFLASPRRPAPAGS